MFWFSRGWPSQRFSDPHFKHPRSHVRDAGLAALDDALAHAWLSRLAREGLRVVARLLDLQDETLRRDASAVLVAVAQGEGPDLALPALELLSAAHAAAASGQVGAGLPAAAELSTLLGDVMTRNLNSRERGVRVSTMTSALRIARVSPALIPAGVAQRAAGDADGYVRDMAARLQRR